MIPQIIPKVESFLKKDLNQPISIQIKKANTNTSKILLLDQAPTCKFQKSHAQKQEKLPPVSETVNDFKKDQAL